MNYEPATGDPVAARALLHPAYLLRQPAQKKKPGRICWRSARGWTTLPDPRDMPFWPLVVVNTCCRLRGLARTGEQ